MAADQVIDVVAVRDRLVAAAWSVPVAPLVSIAEVSRRAPGRVRLPNRNTMLIDVISMHVMHMAIVQVVNVAIVPNGRMSASFAMNVRVLFVGFVLGSASHS
jgi:hypothetical protein